jgi:hypothetical protein
VKVDITVRECLVLPFADRPVLRGYEEYTDLPDDATVRVYCLGETMAEKVVTLTDRARDEPPDLYDVWRLLSEVATTATSPTWSSGNGGSDRGPTGQVRLAHRSGLRAGLGERCGHAC